MLTCAQSIKLRDAIKEYEANKWKVIGQKVGKPAKVSYDPAYSWTPQSNSDRLVNNTPKSTSRISEDLMTVDEVMNSHASFHEFGIPPRILQFHSDARVINGRWGPLILQGRWSW